jgi:hypothetical protein
MKKFVLVLVVLGVVAALGYLLGTAGGRARRNDLLARVRKSSEEAAEPEIDLRETASETAEPATETAEKVGDAVSAPN